MSQPRIVVLLEPGPAAPRAISTAARIAARAGAELVAVFVEDTDLIHWAALPFIREVFFPSAASRETDPATMERQLRARAQSLRRLVAEQAESARVQWSFRVTRGQRMAEALAAALEADLVIGDAPGGWGATREINAIWRGGAPESAFGELCSLAKELQTAVRVLVWDDAGSETGLAALLERRGESSSVYVERAGDEATLKRLLAGEKRPPAG
jgi:nucleotide-binding universal stress UspA family protein